MKNQVNISKNQNSSKEITTKKVEKIDDDFLSGDNQKKSNSSSNIKSASPVDPNPNIGGDENEYEDSTPEENLYDEENLGNEEPENSKESDPVQEENYDVEARHSGPESKNDFDYQYM